MDRPSTSGSSFKNKSYTLSCFVPLCPSTSTKFPDKIFVSVPKSEPERTNWMKAARRDYRYLPSPNSVVRCCEDHFDMENDVENWVRYKLMGGKIILKKGVVPLFFECQGRQKPLKPSLIKKESQEILKADESSTGGCLFTSTCGMSESVHLKEEPEWEEGVYGVSEAAASEGLYDNHEVKQELTLGPEMLQVQDVVYLMQGRLKQEPTQDDVGDLPHSSDSIQRQFALRPCSVKLEPILTDNDNALHLCKTCHKTFELRSNLMSHMCIKIEKETDSKQEQFKKTHHANTQRKTYKCNACQKEFVRKRFLIDHIKMHPGHTPYFCEICNKKFISNTSLKQHRVVHTDGKSFSCDICKKQFSLKTTLRKHILKHSHIKTHSCQICNKAFYARRNLLSHMQGHTGEKPYSCQICQAKFSYKASLATHIRGHTGDKPFVCQVCSRKFTQKCKLIEHTRVHTGEKPHSCQICNKAFAIKSTLARHVRIHTNEKPHSCQICHKQFIQRASLIGHERTHTGIKPYSCHICNKQFAVKANLNMHIRHHIGEKPHSCQICHNTFVSKHTLAKHVRSHSGEKPYSCEICKKQFTEKASVSEHMRIHTGEKPFSCTICSKRFRKRYTLVVHQRVHARDSSVAKGKSTFIRKFRLVPIQSISIE